MVTEDYVSFETAKLLKEKGFDGNSFYVYTLNEESEHCLERLYDDDFFEEEIMIYAPTLQMAMKWLREVHGLNVQVCIVRTIELKKAYNATIYNNNCEQIKSHFGKNILDGFISYEEACEAAINYCLEFLI